MMNSPLQTPRVAQEIDPRTQLRVPMQIGLFQGQTTVGTVFTVDDDADFHIHSLIASNVTGTPGTVTLYIVPSGGTAGATNIYFSELAVPANDYVAIFDGSNIGFMPPGSTLQALVDVNDDINLFGWGYEYQGAYG